MTPCPTLFRRLAVPLPGPMGMVWLVALIAGLCASASAAPVDVAVVYIAADAVYLDGGSDLGLAPGMVGARVSAGDGPVSVQLDQVNATASVARVVGGNDPGAVLAVGDIIRFDAVTPPPTQPEPSLMEPEPTPEFPDTPGDDETFVPLLGPLRPARPVDRGWIWSGNLRASTYWTQDWQRSSAAFRHQLSTTGGIERLFHSRRWHLAWNLCAELPHGEGLAGTSDVQNLDAHVYEFELGYAPTRLFRMSFGRIYPRALPGLGRFDGLAMELGDPESWRVGAVAGLLPDAEDLIPGTVRVGSGIYVASLLPLSTTSSLTTVLGGLATWYKQTADRHAMLADVRLSLAQTLYLSLSGEVDSYDTNDTIRSGVGLTRLNGSLRIVLGAVTLHGGWYLAQLPETEALKAVITDTDRFDDGTRRFSLGISERPSRRVFLDQTVTLWSGANADLEYEGAARANVRDLLGKGYVNRLRAAFRTGSGTDMTRLQVDLGIDLPPSPRWLISFDTGVIWTQPPGTSGITSIIEGRFDTSLRWQVGARLAASFNLEFYADADGRSMSSAVLFALTWRLGRVNHG